MTKRIPLYPSPTLATMVDSGIQPHLGGRSNRICGMLERYRKIIDANSGIESFLEEDEISIIADLLKNSNVGKSGPWLLDWAGLPALFDNEESVKIKLLSFNAAEISALEEYLAMSVKP